MDIGHPHLLETHTKETFSGFHSLSCLEQHGLLYLLQGLVLHSERASPQEWCKMV